MHQLVMKYTSLHFWPYKPTVVLYFYQRQTAGVLDIKWDFDMENDTS